MPQCLAGRCLLAESEGRGRRRAPASLPPVGADRLEHVVEHTAEGSAHALSRRVAWRPDYWHDVKVKRSSIELGARHGDISVWRPGDDLQDLKLQHVGT